VTALETSGLGKRYKRAWALRDCSLRLPAGRVAGLVGPNGAGKTTLLHLAVGLLRPDEGNVRVLGESPDGNAELLARVGFVAQDTPLYAGFSADALIAMGDHLNPRWDASLARGRLGRLGIPLDRKVRKLSGGQRAQVALSLALAKRPELLLLDEPVASLDPLARREFLQGLMGAVAEEGTTVLLSSHLIADLERVCDYLVILYGGRVQVLGAVDDLLAEHMVLVGPRRDPADISAVGTVVSATHGERQSTLIVRSNGEAPDGWDVHEASLEEIVLAYLADESARALPGPAPIELLEAHR
jgi:ABC-2 type transport system ATP-binding protein